MSEVGIAATQSETLRGVALVLSAVLMMGGVQLATPDLLYTVLLNGAAVATTVWGVWKAWKGRKDLNQPPITSILPKKEGV